MGLEFYSVKEAADALNVTVQYIRKMLRDGSIHGEKIGETWIIPCEIIDNYKKIDNRMKKSFVQDQKSQKARSKSKLNTLSFFSGAMGLDIGLEKAGLNVMLACEIDDPCRQTIITNVPEIGLIGDLRDYSVSEILAYANLSDPSEVDVIVGGPPCQAFSTAGRRMGFQDDRGNVFLKFIDLILTIKPKYAIIENVRGLLSSKLSIEINDPFFKEEGVDPSTIPGSSLYYIMHLLKTGGYNVKFNLYNSANFGSPQIRERVVIICTLDKNPVPYLTPTHSEDASNGLQAWKTFKQAVQGLDPNAQEFVNFSAKRLEYFKLLSPGENWRDLPKDLQPIAMGNSYLLGGGKTGFYRRLAWDRPAPTLVTHPAMPATDLGHPLEDRPLSTQEYKRVQEFPDSWNFKGSIIDIYKQIGNAVPVSLGYAIGTAIVNHHKRKNGVSLNGTAYSRYKKTSEEEWLKAFYQSIKPKKSGSTQLSLELS